MYKNKIYVYNDKMCSSGKYTYRTVKSYTTASVKSSKYQSHFKNVVKSIILMVRLEARKLNL